MATAGRRGRAVPRVRNTVLVMLLSLVFVGQSEASFPRPDRTDAVASASGLTVAEGESSVRVFGTPPVPGARVADAGESWVRWDLGNGLFQSDLDSSVVRVQREDGWGVVDHTLVDREGGWSPIRAAGDVRFSGGGDRVVASMDAAGVVTRLIWDGPDMLPGPEVDGPVATFRELLPGVDLLVRTGPVSVHYAWRLGPAAAHAVELSDGLRLRVESDGATPEQTSSRFPVSLAPPPRAEGAGQMLVSGGWHDSAGGPRGSAWPVLREHGDAGASDAGASAAMSLIGDEVVWSWDERPLGANPVFPVFARASQVIVSKSYWMMVWSNGLSFHDDPVENARVGYDGFSSAPKVSRSFFQFDVRAISGSAVQSAELWHAQVHSPQHACGLPSWGATVRVSKTGALQSGPPSWPGPPLQGVQASDSFAHGHRSFCPGDSRQRWDATELLRDAADAGASLVNTALHSAGEGDREGWRQYDNRSAAEQCTDQGGQWEGNCTAPRLQVVHSAKPARPASVAVADTYLDPEGVDPGPWLGVRHHSAAGLTASAVVDTDPPGQPTSLGADFYLQNSAGDYNYDAAGSNGWEPGQTASVVLCTTKECLTHAGRYRLLAFNIVDRGPNQVTASRTLTLRADLEAPAQPQVTVEPAAESGMWTITLHNPVGGADFNVRRLSLGASEEGLYDAALPDELMQDYRDGRDVTVEVAASGPVATFYAQSWDIARNPSPVGSATGERPTAGPGSVWPLDEDGANLVPGGPELLLESPRWTEGRWGLEDASDRALARVLGSGHAVSEAPVLPPLEGGFVVSALLQPAFGTIWTYGPDGFPLVELAYSDGEYTATLAGAEGEGAWEVALDESAVPLEADWHHVSVWFEPGPSRFGITVDGTRSASVLVDRPLAASGVTDLLRLTGTAFAIDQITVVGRGPDRSFLASLAAAPRADFREGQG